jgi:S-DNA-T family DNA segregation ATPase FtsK/SpoIIIE
LDETGAEKLFGKGDMLIKKGGNKPIRAQGCFVSDSDKTGLANVIASHQHEKQYV